MKQFFKYTLATIVGLVVFTCVMGVISIASIVGIIAASSSSEELSDNSVFVLPLKGKISERSDDGLLSQMGASEELVVGLDDILSSIKKAKDNDKIKGIYIEAGMFSAGDPASAQAIRNQLRDFRGSGKWIVAYGDSYTQTAYYICSVADKVWLNPQGTINWVGMASQPYFLKGLLEKLGIDIQLVKVGKYKSAPEMLTADKMSDANREQVTAYLTGIWTNMVDEVAESRNITPAQLNQYADELISLSDAETFVKSGMVDSLIYTTSVKQELKRLLGTGEKEELRKAYITDLKGISDPLASGDEIAVYYAYGNIVDSRAGGLLDKEACIDAQKVVKDLEKLKDDKNVKAVVIRVNSGGGSAYASEQIWKAVTDLKEKKPVVVSMGGYAASGGYYISCNANEIFAEPTSITGSIGIFGMFPDVSKLLKDKLSLKFDVVKTNKFSDFGTPSRPFNSEETAYLEAYIDRGYELFRRRVADGRSMSVDSVEVIAQGRVWLATDAHEIGLVDSLGGLDDAIARAAELASSESWHTVAYPQKPSWMDQLLDEVVGFNGDYANIRVHSALGEMYSPIMLLLESRHISPIQALMPERIEMK